jgi:hypothetical protein
MNDDFEVVGEIADIETIAINKSIREVRQLRKMFGRGRWRKLKGIAIVRLPDGIERKAEVHWYEAHGIGKRKLKIKRYLD